MRSLSIVALMFVMFLASGVASVYAGTGEGNLGIPILGTTGAPALGSPSLFSGAVSVLYADGTPVVLEANQVTLNLCTASNSTTTTPTTSFYYIRNNATSCVTVTAKLRQTSPGSYTYSFTPPASLTGTVTIYIKAYGLADDNGLMFPSVDSSIGTYAFAPSTTSPSTTSTSQQRGTSAPTAGTPPPRLTEQAINTSQSPSTPASPVEALLLTLSALAVAGCLLVIPMRH